MWVTNLPLIRAAERHRDHTLAAQPFLAPARDHRLETGQGLLDRPVHVPSVVDLRSRQEEADLREALTQRERVVEPALVGHEYGDGHLLGDIGPAEHLGPIGQLGDRIGTHGAGDLEPAQSGAGEHLDQAHLVGGLDHLRLVLKPVARADLADAHGILDGNGLGGR